MAFFVGIATVTGSRRRSRRTGFWWCLVVFWVVDECVAKADCKQSYPTTTTHWKRSETEQTILMPESRSEYHPPYAKMTQQIQYRRKTTAYKGVSYDHHNINATEHNHQPATRRYRSLPTSLVGITLHISIHPYISALLLCLHAYLFDTGESSEQQRGLHCFRRRKR